jgi:hypothetical protein
MRRAILKIKEGLAHLSFGLIYDLKDNLKNVFVRKSLVRRWRFFVEMRALNTGTLGTGTVYWYRYPFLIIPVPVVSLQKKMANISSTTFITGTSPSYRDGGIYQQISPCSTVPLCMMKLQYNLSYRSLACWTASHRSHHLRNFPTCKLYTFVTFRHKYPVLII